MSEQQMQEKPNFEMAMDRLEQIVTQLENGDVPLEKAIELFQEGMELSNLCNRKLEEVESKIELLVESNGKIDKKTFTTVNEDKGE
ncbi:exodeoxyribonuclease VII small subunit [Paenibacillus yanchengensis]|uniref:Exodeoxyribonuclease 7 small subunit n=1 Tax=Paenibacillus yanchengensis TaxID=2035833 RepID=A0ABW4YKI2_9BACL